MAEQQQPAEGAGGRHVRTPESEQGTESDALNREGNRGEPDPAEGRDVPPSNPRPGGTRGSESPWLGGG